MKNTFFLSCAFALMFGVMGCRPKPEPAKKPIIYLYPTEKMQVSVRLDVAGKLTTTYPKYNSEAGWSVIAQPNGTLTDPITGKEFYALYWEGENIHLPKPETGFVIRGTETVSFLEEKLAVLGLSRKEANEFIVYWLPKMQDNAYNFVHFAGQDYTEQATLSIIPKPETIIRVFMQFQALDAPVNITPQILETPIRKGFTVVEWGGSELKNWSL